MSSQNRSNPLSDITSSQTNANPLDPMSDDSSKPAPGFTQESRQHRLLHSKLVKQEQSGKQAGTYVSPSDDILSPASAKLNAFKEKRFTAKSAKPRTLFAKTKSYSSADPAGGIDAQLMGSENLHDTQREEDTRMSEG